MKMTVRIANGPEKDKLFNSLKEGYLSEQSYVSFIVPEAKIRQIDVAIVSIQQEDGSGNSWNIEGFVRSGNEIKGYYNSLTRTGTFNELPEQYCWVTATS